MASKHQLTDDVKEQYDIVQLEASKQTQVKLAKFWIFFALLDRWKSVAGKQQSDTSHPINGTTFLRLWQAGLAGAFY